MPGHGQEAVMEGRCQAVSNRPWTGGGDGGKVSGHGQGAVMEGRCQAVSNIPWTGGGDGGKVPGRIEQTMDRRR